MSIEIKDLKYTYGKGTIFEYQALNGVNLSLKKHSFSAIVGKTGSGKSSLIQHLNAILLPESGSLKIDEFEVVPQVGKKKVNYKQLRKKVGLVFQFSDYQLFEETVLLDVMFGPLNFDLSEEEAKTIALKYLKMVNLDESLYEKSPFELSGGQKRRVAIAGILAMEPDIVVLDEPTAGLDPQGAVEIMKIFLSLKNDYNKTLVLVSHDMDFVYEYADEVILLNAGKVVVKKDVVSFFNDDSIRDYGIEIPKIVDMYNKVKLEKPNQKLSFDDLISVLEEKMDNVK